MLLNEAARDNEVIIASFGGFAVRSPRLMLKPGLDYQYAAHRKMRKYRHAEYVDVAGQRIRKLSKFEIARFKRIVSGRTVPTIERRAIV